MNTLRVAVSSLKQPIIFKRFIKVILFVCIISILLSGCSTRLKADISSYQDEKILIIGLEDENFYITPAELAEMECVNETQTGKTAKAGTVNAVGPTMETFLEKYDKKQTDFEKIKFYARDDYYTYILEEDLKDSTIILSIADGDNPLGGSEQPLRILIPGAESSKWIRMVDKIEFTEKN